VEALIAALTDEDASVRADAARALGGLGDRQAVPALVAALQRSEAADGESLADVQAAAARALSSIGDPQAVKPLVRYAASEWTDEELVPLIAAIGEPAVKPLITILGGRSLGQRQVAAQALGEIGDPRAVPALLAFGRKDETATAALVDIGKPAVPALVKALDDPATPIRATAAEALGGIGDRRATDELSDALADPEDDVWRAASDALALMYRKDVGTLLPWLESQPTLPVYYGLIGLGKKGTEDELVAALESYGTEEMAEDYLNCGSPKLEAAAKRWAEGHGYTVITTPGFGESESWGRLG
jgi:HEAT repeat protein